MADLEALVELRLIAMRPSLEKVGRFKPERARQRFVDEFAPEHTTILLADDQLIGCYALFPREQGLYLAHLYISPAHQGRGIGQVIVQELKAKAAAAGEDIYLTAITDSDAEHFYVRHGFAAIDRDDIEVEMVWRSPPNA